MKSTKLNSGFSLEHKKTCLFRRLRLCIACKNAEDLPPRVWRGRESDPDAMLPQQSRAPTCASVLGVGERNKIARGVVNTRKIVSWG